MPAVAEKLPNERDGRTRKFSIPMNGVDADGQPAKLKFYITANTMPDGSLREIFIRADKVGSFVGGILDIWATTLSIGLQHGVPLTLLLEKMRHSKFDPSGFTGDPEFPSCSSAIDLVAQWLAKNFVKDQSS